MKKRQLEIDPELAMFCYERHLTARDIAKLCQVTQTTAKQWLDHHFAPGEHYELWNYLNALAIEMSARKNGGKPPNHSAKFSKAQIARIAKLAASKTELVIKDELEIAKRNKALDDYLEDIG
jgi:cytochrome P450